MSFNLPPLQANDSGSINSDSNRLQVATAAPPLCTPPDIKVVIESISDTLMSFHELIINSVTVTIFATISCVCVRARYACGRRAN